MKSKQKHWEMHTIKNTGQIRDMQLLLKFKTILIQQLPSINLTTIIKTIFDKTHTSIIFMASPDGVDDGKATEIICGACFRVFDVVSMIDLVYFVTNHKHQGRGYGNQLMIALKNFAKQRHISKIVTHADVSALSFYEKSGFIAHNHKKNSQQKQIWQPYLQDYQQSQLMVYQVNEKFDYNKFNEIVNQQYCGLLTMFDDVKYQGYHLLKQQAQKLVEWDIERYYQSKGRKYISRQKKLKNQEIQYQLKQQLLSTKQVVERLEQLAIVETIQNSKHSWLLSFAFSYIPSVMKEKVTKIITLQQIHENVLADQYCNTFQMIAQVQKAIGNLKWILPADTLYYQTLRKLEGDIKPTIQHILNGTFNPKTYFKSSISKQPCKNK